MLQSSDVVATMRVSSFVSGGTVGSLHVLASPNQQRELVRNNEGRWNTEKLVRRAASFLTAPTRKASRSQRKAAQH